MSISPKPAFKGGDFVRCVHQVRYNQVGVVMRTTDKGVRVHFEQGIGLLHEGYLRPTKRRVDLPQEAWTKIREEAVAEKSAYLDEVFPPKKTEPAVLGEEKFDLGDGYALTFLPGNHRDESRVMVGNFTRGGENAGVLIVGGKPGDCHVRSVISHHEGEGLYRRALKTLADHLGEIKSDPGLDTNSAADAAWLAVGATKTSGGRSVLQGKPAALKPDALPDVPSLSKVPPVEVGSGLARDGK